MVEACCESGETAPVHRGYSDGGEAQRSEFRYPLLRLTYACQGEVPSSTRAAHYVGAFSVSATTATQYLPLSGLVAYDLPRAAEYYVLNSTNQTVSSGWQLTVTPRAIVPTP